MWLYIPWEFFENKSKTKEGYFFERFRPENAYLEPTLRLDARPYAKNWLFSGLPTFNYQNHHVCRLYLDPQSMYINGPKPLKTTQKAIFLHTLGVQVPIISIQGSFNRNLTDDTVNGMSTLGLEDTDPPPQPPALHTPCAGRCRRQASSHRRPQRSPPKDSSGGY